MKSGTHFYGLRSYLTKIHKKPLWGIFFIMLLNYEVLATQNHDERYIVFFQISQLFKFKMFFIISTSKGKC